MIKPGFRMSFLLLLWFLTCRGEAMGQMIQLNCMSDTLVCHPGNCSGTYSINESIVNTFSVSDPGKIIRMEFLHFSLAEDLDHLKVYDGGSTSDPLIGTYFGKDSPGVLVSSGPAITLEFYSDESGTGTGWSATIGCRDSIPVKLLDSSREEEWCYPRACSGNYPDKADTLFVYRALDYGQVLRAGFSSFDLPDPSDVLEVYDGYSTEAPLLGSFTGSALPDTLLSTGPFLTFRFVSDSALTGSGWKGWIHPLSLVSGEDLEFTVSFQGGERVYRSLDPERVLLARYWFSSLQGDSVSFYDGDSDRAPLIRTSSGIFEYHAFISSGPYLTIGSAKPEAQVDLTMNLFSIRRMEPDSIIECGPGGTTCCYPPSCIGSYGENEGFVQTYRASDSTSILKLTIHRMEIDPYPDDLKIYDGPSLNAPVLSELCEGCGPFPNSILSSGPAVTFEFHSDSKTLGVEAGWELSIECAEKLEQEVVHFGEALTKCFPGNCQGTYKSGLDTVMVFVAENSQGGIEANFTSFFTAAPGDFLEVYDGYSSTAPLIGRYSGSRNPGTLLSSGQYLTFRFVTDGEVEGPGWQAVLRCHERVPCEENFYYTSSGENLKTFWLEEPDGILEAAFITDLAAGDTVYFYDGSSEADPVIGILAGPRSRTEGEILVHPTGRSLTYWANVQDPFAYHIYNLSMSCTLPEPEIVIDCSEPVYICNPPSCSGDYPTWDYFIQTYLASDERAWLALDIEQFSIEKGYDSLWIYDGNSLFAPLLGAFSGDSIPGTILTSGPSVTFEFNSDELITDEGWIMRFRCVVPEATDESDSLALVDIFNRTGGPFWNRPWMFEEPVYLWNGIVVQDRRVTDIDLAGNNLTGPLPESICNLTDLRQINLSSNRLTGSIPGCLGNLTEIRSIDLGNNLLSGYIPQELGKLMHLSEVDLSNNALSGSLGISLMGNPNITSINVSNNRLIDVVTAGTQSLQWLNVEQNYLDFKDLSNNLLDRGTFQYIYRQQKPTGKFYLLPPGSTHTVEPEFNRSSQQEDITYHWYVSNLMTAWDQPTLEITGLEYDDVGIYECRATHREVPGVELRHMDTIAMEPGIPRVVVPDPFCLGDNHIILTELDGKGQETMWFGDSLLTDTIGTGPTVRLTMHTDSDTIYVVNRSGSLLSEVLKIELFMRPSIRFEGERLLTREIEGAVYQWYYDKTLLESEHSYWIESRGDGEYFVSVRQGECQATSVPAILENGKILGEIRQDYPKGTNVYPNPTNGILNVKFAGYHPGPVRFSLYDVTGNLRVVSVLSGDPLNDGPYQFDLGSLPSGAYFLKVQWHQSEEIHLILRN